MAYFSGGTTILATNGSTSGVCTVADSSILAQNATAYLSGTALPTLEVVITNVAGSVVALRLKSAMPTTYGTDISAYTTAAAATLWMPPQNAWPGSSPVL
jgi:hypothetical protein